MKQVRFFIIPLFFLMALMASFPAFADSDFWQQTHDFVLKCAVQPFAVRAGHKVFHPLRSICPNLVVKNGNALFTMNGKSYRATLHESDYSDGGDLNDVVVTSTDGSFSVERTYIPAFNDVILALAGGDDGFPMVQSDEEAIGSPDSN